jgi:flagellar hook-associated protein 3 FlgL
MRISTNSMYSSGVSQLNTLQSNLARTQMQLSANRRLLTPSDDPIASARVIETTQSQSVNAQYGVNRQNARSSLTMVESALGNATGVLQDVQELTVRAGSGALSATDRATLADEAASHLESLLGIANSSDGEGYLFAGFKTTTEPFSRTATGAQYLGDQGQRKLQVSSARQFAISTPGSNVFENNPTGNGKFVTGTNAANTGTGVVSGGAVANPAALTGHDYQLSFAVAGTPAVTTFTVLDTATGLAPAGLAGPQPFVAGQQIAFDGVTLDIKGAPANGDGFTVEPSATQSVFTTLTELIATLRAPVAAGAGGAALTNGLSKANENLSSALDSVLGERAAAGARLKELDELDSAGEDLDIQYAGTLSQLQDLDLVATITKFTQQQFSLEAAQKSFKSLSGLSLFNYIS